MIIYIYILYDVGDTTSYQKLNVFLQVTMATFVERCTTSENGANPANNLRKVMSIEQSAAVVESEADALVDFSHDRSASRPVRVDGSSAFASATVRARRGRRTPAALIWRQPLNLFYDRRTSATLDRSSETFPRASLHVADDDLTTLTFAFRSERSHADRFSPSPSSDQSSTSGASGHCRRSHQLTNRTLTMLLHTLPYGHRLNEAKRSISL